MKWKPFALVGVVAALLLAGCTPTEVVVENTPVENAPAPAPTVSERGKIMVELYPAKAPKTCEQILSLIDKGFYENQRFHRVEDIVIQWGDPQSKDPNWQQLPVGTQGSGKQLPFEANDLKMVPGALAMASTGEKVGGDSQMFIVKSACPPAQGAAWQGNYAIFGKVIEGMAVVDSLAQGDILVMKRVGAKATDRKAPVKVEITVKAGG